MSLATDIRKAIQSQARTVLVCSYDACLVYVASPTDDALRCHLRMFLLEAVDQDIAAIKHSELAKRPEDCAGSVAWNNYWTNCAGLAVCFEVHAHKLYGGSNFTIRGEPWLFNLGAYAKTPSGVDLFSSHPELLDIFDRLMSVQEPVTR